MGAAAVHPDNVLCTAVALQSLSASAGSTYTVSGYSLLPFCDTTVMVRGSCFMIRCGYDPLWMSAAS
jgi:hypothetical protein